MTKENIYNNQIQKFMKDLSKTGTQGDKLILCYQENISKHMQNKTTNKIWSRVRKFLNHEGLACGKGTDGPT